MDRSDHWSADAYDAIVVGGGPAGLSAALILGRARRRTLVVDDGHPRNAVAEAMHGFITRDGTPPAAFAAAAWRELAAYPSVALREEAALEVARAGDGFRVVLATSAPLAAKRLILATGVFDVLPDVDGLAERWGKSVFVCPFCDGWELQDRRIAVYGRGADAVALAQELAGWTRDLVVCAERDELCDADRRWVERAGATLRIGRLRALRGPVPRLERLAFGDGEEAACEALFLSAPLRQHSPLFAQLGCVLAPDGRIAVDPCYRTSVPGCYAAGDAVTTHHQVLIAAASGASAAIALSSDLLEREAADLTELRRTRLAPHPSGR